MRDIMERQQVWIYLMAVLVAGLTGFAVPDATALERAINPALALMLFVTFLQVPLSEIGRGFREARFLGALLVSNFLVVPILALALAQLAIDDALLRLGILMVLLTPCIDYVITFDHLGRADARLLLSSTPVLLLVQMALLPLYLGLFLGGDVVELVRPGPFVHAFVWLIAVPLICAGVVQFWAASVQLLEFFRSRQQPWSCSSLSPRQFPFWGLRATMHYPPCQSISSLPSSHRSSAGA